MKIQILVSTIILMFLINGCIPFVSDYPITKKGNIKIDENLIGEWNIKSELGIYKILVEPIDDKKYLGSYYRLYEKNNQLTNTNTGFGYISKINDSEYINVQIAFGDSITKNKYVFFKIEPINKDSIELFYLSGLKLDTVFISSKGFVEFIKVKQDSFELAFDPVGVATREIPDEKETLVTSLAQSMDFVSPIIFPDDVKDAYIINKDRIIEAKLYFESIVPNDYSIYLEFIDYKKVDFKVYKKNENKIEEIIQVWDTDINSQEIKDVIKVLNWNDYEIIILREKVYNANCISIANSKINCEVGYQRSGMGKYYFDLFDTPIPHDKWENYNDSCTYIMIDSLTVIEYEGPAFGYQCMPLRKNN